MELLQSFRAFIQANELVGPSERVLVAISGGVDSVVLAHLVQEAGLEFGLAHCNFQLRGAESDGDEAFVRELAQRWNVPCFVQHFDTHAYSAEKGISTQMAARELRYDWFDQIRAEHGYAVTALGHNLNDSIETALLYFIRGTGLTGLGGIPVRNGPVVRPLLFASRDEIQSYAQTHGLAWREDSSNATDHYVRNVIRHHIIPRMAELNPAFLASAAHTLERVRASDQNLQFLLRNLLGKPDADGIYHLEKDQLIQLPLPFDALFDLLQPFGFSPEQVRQMVENWSQTGSEWFSGTGWRLLNDRAAFLLTSPTEQPEVIQIEANDLMVRLPDGSRLVLTPAAPGSPLPEERAAVLADADKLHFPLHLRRWKPGDVFQPLGMHGQHQKLQDFFTNLKLSRLEKDNTWILEDSDRTIIWVVGMRLDERFKITSETCKLLKFSWLKEW